MILVRHSQPEIQRELPAAQWRLSQAGQARCHQLAAQLAAFAPDAIYSSPEAKAQQTAAILASALRIPWTEIAELAEHDRTDVPFLTAEEFEAGIARFFQHREQIVFGSESAVQALQRFEAGVRSALAGAQQPIVVTHGTVMSLYLAERAGVDALTIWKSLVTPCYVVCPDAAGSCSAIQYIDASKAE